MAAPELLAKAEESQNDAFDVDVLRRQRERAFRDVGFEVVAEQKAVNGYSTIVPSSDHKNTASSDSGLSTPLIDISNMGGVDGNLRDDGSSMQQQQQQQRTPLEGEPNSSSVLSPEAGLHRDREQARLVEPVRQRQLQQQQYYEDNWLEDSTVQFWERLLVFGGIIEDPSNSQGQCERIIPPENPYRDSSRPRSDNSKISHEEQKDNDKSSSYNASTCYDASHQTEMNRSISSRPKSLLKRERILRFALHILLQTLHAFRWLADFCITRLARLEPLEPLSPNGSSSTYLTSPAYSLRVTADDILLFLVIILVFFYCILYVHAVATPFAIMTCLFIWSFSQKVVGRVQQSLRCEQQKKQIHHSNQSSTRRGASQASAQPMDSVPAGTPAESRATMDALHRKSMQNLLKQYPDAKPAECKRFFICEKYNEKAASKRLGSYLNWRFECGLKSTPERDALTIDRCDRAFDGSFAERDADDWNACAKTAISLTTKSPAGEDGSLPQIICSYEGAAGKTTINDDIAGRSESSPSSRPPPRYKDGTRIFHILPARVDLSVAAAPAYSLALALYIDRRMSRSTTEFVTLFCDLRGGRGWANPTPWSLLPFIRSTASLLGTHYPERLKRLVLVPMPKSAIWVWNVAQKCLDADTASKVVIMSEREGGGLPAELLEYVTDESLDILEKRRSSFFTDRVE